MKKINSISLFSGAMGLDLGLEQAGIQTLMCNEIDVDAVKTIRANRPKLKVFDKSIADLTKEEILEQAKGKDIDLVVGGPPCQSFSVFGNRKGVQDLRGQLIFEYFRIVKEVQPKAFIMENVRGLLSIPIVSKKDFDPESMDVSVTKKGSLIHYLFTLFEDIGYRIDCYVVNSVNYGAPQIRERVIIIGNRFGLATDFPEPEYSNRPQDNLPAFRTLGDAIGEGFEDPCPEVLNFSPRKLKYLSMVPSGGNWRSLPVEVQKESMGKSWYLKGGRSAYWRKLSFEFPSPTVVTMPNHAGTSMCHPTELRAISVGEAAAIQEFPRDWSFQGSTASKFKQIGNAVPVRLGFVAGETVSRLIERINSNHKDDKVPSHRIIHLRPHVRTRTFYKDGKAYAGDHSYYKNNSDNLDLFKNSELLEAAE